MSAMGRHALLSLLLVACGLVRLAVAPDQAVEEYGRDWNVFFSLAAVKLAGSATELLALPAVAARLGRGLPPAAPACLLLLAYEVALGPGGLALAIVRPLEAAEAESAAVNSGAGVEYFSRRGVGFLDANREGLASCVGLYCLYLGALQFGRFAMPLLTGRRLCDLGRMAGWCCALTAGALAVHALPYAGLALPESRRLTNLAYAAWILGFCWAYLAACAGVSVMFCLLAAVCSVRHQHHRCPEQLLHLDPPPPPLQQQPPQPSAPQLQQQQQPPPPPSSSPLLELVDSRGLAYFLIGNLLTGLLGHCLLPVLYGRRDFGRAMPPWACVPVLAGYMLALTLLTYLLPPLSAIGGSLRRSKRPEQAQQQTPPQQPQIFQLQTVTCL